MRLLFLLPFVLAAPAAAAPFQNTAALDRAVAGFTERPIGAEGGARTPVDSRLRLAICATVALSWRSEAHDAVVVSCSEPTWRVFVPVARAVPVAAAAPAAAAPAPKAAPVIRRGDPILIEADADGFSVAREGVAMGDAAPGARLAVKVDDARTPVQAIAVDTGRATLPGW